MCSASLLTCQCFGGEFDSGVAFSAHVPEAVPLLSDAAADEADDTGPVDRLGKDVGEVRRHKHNQWLNVGRVFTPLKIKYQN